MKINEGSKNMISDGRLMLIFSLDVNFPLCSITVLSYRSWLERIRKENPAFLTIVSLELPESPIPLIESQANARWKRDESNEVASEKDDILDEFLEKVTEAGRERERESRTAKNNLSRKSRRSGRRNGESLECTKTLATLEECTRNIVEGQIIIWIYIYILGRNRDSF